MKTRKPSQVPAALKSVDVKALLRKRGVYAQLRINKELKEAAIPLAKKMLASTRRKTVEVQSPEKLANPQTPERFVKFWQKQIHIVETAEVKFEKKVEQFIQHVEKGFMTNFDAEVNTQKQFVEFAKKDYFGENEKELLVKAQIDFAPLLQNVAVLAGNEAQKLLNLKTPYIPFDYNEAIAKNVERFTKSLLDTDRDHLTNIISNGLQDGKSVPEIRSLIESNFDDYSRMQATRITRTEVLRASNQASLDAYEQSDVVEAKQWLTAGATDECASYEGQMEYLSDNFYQSSDFADGDPPLHPNCRCVLIPVVQTDHAGSTLLRDNESGFLSLDAEDPDETQHWYRGESTDGSHRSYGTDLFGEGLYVGTKSQARQFGDKIFNFPSVPIPEASILKIANQSQLESLVTGAQKWAVKNGKALDPEKIIPQYARTLGFKAIGATEEFEPYGGVNIIDKKIVKQLTALMASQKSIDQDNEEQKARVAELEAQIDKRTKEFREIKETHLEDQEYIKELEELLDAKRALSEDS